jgi:hypothetical protein
LGGDDEQCSDPNEQECSTGEERSLLERGGLEFQPQFVGAVPRSMKLSIRWPARNLGVFLPILVARLIAEIVRMANSPAQKIPIRLGDSSEIIVGEDVRAIGHPQGNDWSLTEGIISQYRRGYVWAYDYDDAETTSDQTLKHKYDVIQTQTPINPEQFRRSSDSESGTLIGVNTSKGEGEGLNFAVSVDDVRRFLTERLAAER